MNAPYRATLREMVRATRTAGISLALLVACNTIVGFDDLERTPSKTPSDGSAGDDDVTGEDDDDVAPADGGPDGTEGEPRCDPSKPFGAPAVVEVGADQVKETKRALMTPDELELFYLRGTSSPFDLRHARRAKRTDGWGEPTTESLTPDAISLSALVLGGKKLYYWSFDTSGASGTIATFNNAATRPALGTAFSPGQKLGGIDRAITATESDDSAYWSDVEIIDALADQLLVQSNLQGNSIVGRNELPGLHHVPSLDTSPVISPNQLVLYFASQRSIPGALGSDDVYRTRRASRAEPFDAPVNVTELNSTTVDEPSWVSDDDCVILLTRSRHILIAQRPH